jgi:hypothetical protein
VEALVPDQKMFDLCRQISTELDPVKMAALVEELIKLLNAEQDAIKAKIRVNLSSQSGTLD